MDVQALLVVAFGGQLLTETSPVTLPDAQVWVKSEVQNHMRIDAEAAKRMPLWLLELKQAGMLKREYLPSIVQDVVRRHYVAASCKLLPLPESIFNDRYGNLSQRDLLRVFYLLHGDEQPDGWSCGFRSDFSAAALHKELQSGSLVLSHENIGQTCHDLREKTPGLKESIEYIILRSKLDQVVSILKRDTFTLDLALDLLRKDKPDFKEVLLKIQADYFIRKVALDFLSETPPRLCDAIALLGKAYCKEVRDFSDELVHLLVEKLEEQNDLRDRVSTLILSILQEASHYKLPPHPQKDSDFNCFIAWGENLVEHRAQFVAIALQSGHSGVRKCIETKVCKNRPLLKKCFEELELALREVDLSKLAASKVEDCRSRLRKYVKSSIQKVQDELCEEDPRLKKICEILDRSMCPQLKSAIALFNSSDSANDEVVALLRRSAHPQIAPALLCLKEHSEIQECISEIAQLLQIYEKENIARIIADLSKVNAPQATKVIELLGISKKDGEDSQFEHTMRMARHLLMEADRQKISEAFLTLEPQYPKFDPVTYTEAVVKKIDEDLEKSKDPSIMNAINLLEVSCTQKDAQGAEALIEKGDMAAKKDALALLRSDHTAGVAWCVLDDCKMAADCIDAIKVTLPAENKYADPDHLIRLATMPALGLPPENVHILGDFKQKGNLLFDFSDAILSDAQQGDLQACMTEEEQSKMVEDAIRTHFKKNYLDNDAVCGAHYFVCNITRSHWILVALVKLPRKKPILVILDSKNFTIQSNNSSNSVGTDTVIAFLYNRFIRPFN